MCALVTGVQTCALPIFEGVAGVVLQRVGARPGQPVCAECAGDRGAVLVDQADGSEYTSRGGDGHRLLDGEAAGAIGDRRGELGYQQLPRSEETRAGKECGSKVRSRGAPEY